MNHVTSGFVDNVTTCDALVSLVINTIDQLNAVRPPQPDIRSASQQTGYPVWQHVGGGELSRGGGESGEQGGGAGGLRVWNHRKPSHARRADARPTSAIHGRHREVVQRQLHRTRRRRLDLLPCLLLHSYHTPLALKPDCSTSSFSPHITCTQTRLFYFLTLTTHHLHSNQTVLLHSHHTSLALKPDCSTFLLSQQTTCTQTRLFYFFTLTTHHLHSNQTVLLLHSHHTSHALKPDCSTSSLSPHITCT